MIKKKVLLQLAILQSVFCFATQSVVAEEHMTTQKNKEFNVDHLKIKVGDTVHFKNEDSFFHNVFSLSDEKMFDLGSYPQGQSKSVVFDVPGKIEVECAIHPNMMLTIDVEP